MAAEKKESKIIREFKPTTISLKNKNTIYLLAFLLVLFGIISYNTMPVEAFPEVRFAYVFVKTVYPGNPPIDIENLITRPLEKEIHTINGIKELRSTSTQDNSDIFIEFNPNVDINEAFQDVKDGVDNAKRELPNDLDMDPFVMEIDVNEFPIININLSGDYSIDELKEYAEYLEEEIEDVPEISKVEIKGLNNREIQINVDRHKLDTFKLTFNDIENAVNFENISISGGDLKIEGTTRSIRTVGEFTDVDEIKDIIVKHEKGNIVYLRDVAEVIDGYEDPLTLARLDRQPVVSLQVIKKSGENLLDATEKIFKILTAARATNSIPKDLNIAITNDQSNMVKKMVGNLENNIIMGIIFVILVLFFFLGLRNGLFVGIAIPMSMFISFVVLNLIGSTINMMVLFGLVLALGMLVDNAIVVVENSYRFVHLGHSYFDAIKIAVGEIAMAIIASTATTLAAFSPIVFWPGLMGEFMKHLPITLIIVLSSSLFVALIIIPVLTKTFLKKDEDLPPPDKKKTLIRSCFFIGAALIFYLIKIALIGNILVIITIVLLFYRFILYSAASRFRKVFFVKLEHRYSKILTTALKGRKPAFILLGTCILFILVMIFFGMRKPRIELFPPNEPTFINVVAELPTGSDITATDIFMQEIEDKIFSLLEPNKKIVKSILTTIGKGVVEENEFSVGNTLNKGMTTISFVDYEDRDGIVTSGIMKQISNELIGKYPGIRFSITKNAMGPPSGKPVNLEIIGKDFDRLQSLAESVQQHIENEKIAGIEELRMDLETGKPELLINIDREKARRFGLSTAQIAVTIRTALFGKEISDFKEGEDEFPIQLRLARKYRNNIASLMNQKITFRSQSSGKIMQVPISAVATFNYSTTYGSVKRKDMERVITIYSNISEGFNAASINAKLKALMTDYPMPGNYKYKFTGEQEDMEETMSFLSRTMVIALSLILIILVTQFNSLVKPIIIIASVFFSTIGVFGGIAIFRMDFIVVMTGIGIISLAGVVVNNAIVLIDYIDYLKKRKKSELGIDEEGDLPLDKALECIIQGGKTRLRPVLLTAITTILGLLPMASGININFSSLLLKFQPQIYFGGDNAAFWGPMAWAVIFGLTFATFLTLILVPVMYLIGNKMKLKFVNGKVKK
ncbi:MAG: efflux RND transporter permease subunit [Candidatus Aminicenantes bacterium]|nr:efflux RND transporter permease subunit [Candidatus Aminicenantes bacterium]